MGEPVVGRGEVVGWVPGMKTAIEMLMKDKVWSGIMFTSAHNDPCCQIHRNATTNTRHLIETFSQHT